MGPRCTFTHDPAKVAVCRDFLKSGQCSQGQHCDLSHHLTNERVPACIHFVRGTCSKQTCRYPHVRVSPGAQVCRPFGTLGYCDKGILCQERHVFECPDYSQSGNCPNEDCRLPHVDRAGQLRQQHSEVVIGKTDANQDTHSALSNVEHTSEIDRDDLDLDEMATKVIVEASRPECHPLSQQQDFVHF